MSLLSQVNKQSKGRGVWVVVGPGGSVGVPLGVVDTEFEPGAVAAAILYESQRRGCLPYQARAMLI
ncbi:MULTISPECIES: hypothetical protein [unclassified Mycobacterium]|uniref:hypothetical protein n=1 Tax=unclassified Mycobacterium TaxID=2642494 RepID=UPI0029C90B92|nr:MULTISPECIES: hypothetical protein [unclassified Mycobacterium]